MTTWESTRYGGKDYEAACRQMSLEVAAACRGALAAGWEAVVKDGHEDAMNIDPDLLPRGTQLIRGWMSDPYSMMGGLDESYDGIVYIGYHSGAWTDTSPLKHTGEDYLFNWIKINGEYASEFTLNSILADQFGVPSLLLTGTRASARTPRHSILVWLPWRQRAASATPPGTDILRTSSRRSRRRLRESCPGSCRRQSLRPGSTPWRSALRISSGQSQRHGIPARRELTSTRSK